MSYTTIVERHGWGGFQKVLQDGADRRFHTYVIGKTGAGKSTLLRNLIVQAIENGEGVGLLDPHGDLSREVLSRVPPGRIGDVVYFNPADLAFPFGLNVLKNGERSDLVASAVVSAFKNIWSDSWGPRLEYILYASIAALCECENTSLLCIPRLLKDEAYRLWVARQVQDPIVGDFWRREFSSYDKKLRSEAISPILNKIGQFLMSPVARNILGQVKSRLDISQVLNRRQIFVANLAKASIGDEKACLLGSLLVSQFQMAAMGQARMPEDARPDFFLCIDEFSNFVTESFCSILSESRKYGLHLTLAHQYIEQVRPEIREAVFGNVGSLISFRIGHADAEVIAKELYGLAPEQLSGLGKYEVAAKLVIGGCQSEPFLGRSLAPAGCEYGLQTSVIRRCRERFCTPVESVEAKIDRWLSAGSISG